ncbi:MAG: TIGR04211 family SH3 domain-containing protein [Alteromonadaceae bacterium]|nr:TIGR04211 family SH3 domain-containing protein [Alteromonadaceae bacterium]
MRFVSLVILFFGLFLLSAISYSQSQSTVQTTESTLSPAETLNTEAPLKDIGSTSTAYISDELFIFMRSGAGKQYRLLGSITAGSAITLIDEVTDGFQKIIDDKGRSGWIEEQYISKKPSLRSVIAELNAQIADKDETIKNFDTSLNGNQQKITYLAKMNSNLKLKITSLKKQLTTNQAKVQQHDNSTQKQWFFNGAIVLGIGLLLGLLLPRLFSRRRNSMDSWQ